MVVIFIFYYILMSPLFKSIENCSFSVGRGNRHFDRRWIPIKEHLIGSVDSIEDSVMTALTHYTKTLLAAQSLETLSHSFPAKIILGCLFTKYSLTTSWPSPSHFLFWSRWSWSRWVWILSLTSTEKQKDLRPILPAGRRNVDCCNGVSQVQQRERAFDGFIIYTQILEEKRKVDVSAFVASIEDICIFDL